MAVNSNIYVFYCVPNTELIIQSREYDPIAREIEKEAQSGPRRSSLLNSVLKQ